MRYVTWILFSLLVVGCAKSSDAPSDVVCVASAFPEQVLYPDNVIRKSQVSTCSDNCELYDPVDDAAEGFSSCD